MLLPFGLPDELKAKREAEMKEAAAAKTYAEPQPSNVIYVDFRRGLAH